MSVETYLLVKTDTNCDGVSPSSTSKNSWKDIREILATASNEVNARAETNIVMIQSPQDCGKPNCATKPVTPAENLVKGVAVSAKAMLARAVSKTPVCFKFGNEPTMTITNTASNDSNNIEP